MSEFRQDSLRSLEELRWENRIILVHETDSAWGAVSEFESAQSGIDERHIAWFVFGESGTVTNYEGALDPGFADRTLNQYFRSKEGRVVMIGKDGGVKSRSTELDLDDLFALIDTMPMRRAEMGR